MPRFRFPLDPLIRMRQRTERERMTEVAELERQRVALEDRIRACQSRIVSGKSAVREGLVGAVDLTALRGEAAGALHATREAQRLVLELAGVHRRLEEARRRLAEAARDRRAVELLRERRLAEFRRAVRKQEEAEIDELAAHGGGDGDLGAEI